LFGGAGVGAILCLALLAAARPAGASELAEFHSAVAQAFGPYRTALTYLRTGNVDAAAFELENMIAAWRGLERRFGGNPPDALSGDESYDAVIERIGGDSEAALEAIDAGEPEKARELLQPLHLLMSDLRRRNGLYLLPDCIRELSDAMDALWVYREEMPDLTQAGARVAILTRAAVVEHETARCEAMASAEQRRDPEFRRLFDIFYDGMAPLRTGVVDQDAVRIINVLRELRSAQRLIFFRFG
jgi:hypothetical protein